MIKNYKKLYEKEVEAHARVLKRFEDHRKIYTLTSARFNTIQAMYSTYILEIQNLNRACIRKNNSIASLKKRLKEAQNNEQ